MFMLNKKINEERKEKKAHLDGQNAQKNRRPSSNCCFCTHAALGTPLAHEANRKAPFRTAAPHAGYKPDTKPVNQTE
jgi:hypothetical protein